MLPEIRVSTTQDKGYLAANSVSATRISTPIKDLPFAVSAFTEQFIEDVGAHDLWDIVQFAPSVTSPAASSPPAMRSITSAASTNRRSTTASRAKPTSTL
ncbi:hypothetical protein OH491_27295 [Termitidicoccus mucosus]|uniref:Uncharacterized protein n=1 Tax=Termitidicoccus mucosus TaxID=1184151 RepID=A0A178IBL6_9BACT|nr:hypothetical protein AW736_23480 [Opitutaceae bacterium TSB47]